MIAKYLSESIAIKTVDVGADNVIYEIAKKYKDWDITVFYDSADPSQLKRLRKFFMMRLLL